MAEIPVSGAWSGTSAILIGGGPSLKEFDWRILENRKHIIAVNRAFMDVPHADMFFTEDVRFIERYATALREFAGLKVFHALDEFYVEPALRAVPDLAIVRKTRPDKFWSKSFAEGLSYSSNSMIGALNIADILGADPIYLLGVDCNPEPWVISNYHTGTDAGYPQDWQVNGHQLTSYKSDFEHWAAPNLRHRRIVNLNVKSAVEVWPRVAWQTVLS